MLSIQGGPIKKDLKENLVKLAVFIAMLSPLIKIKSLGNLENIFVTSSRKCR